MILASSSPFRKEQLSKLCLTFETNKPEVDETAIQGETVPYMVQRLSLAKAQKVAQSYQNQVIIASDQSASFNNLPIGKPGSHGNAIEQLTGFSGKTVHFYTGLAVIDQKSGQIFEHLDETKVTFRHLSKQDIENYLLIEKPYQCAGSFKSEGLGITLFEKIESNDPNALIGLPLIALTSILKQIGVQLPPNFQEVQ